MSHSYEPSHLDSHYLLIHFAFFSISIFAGFFLRNCLTPLFKTWLFYNLKCKSLPQKLCGESGEKDKKTLKTLHENFISNAMMTMINAGKQ